MVEWFKAAVLKTAEGQLSEGSNPSSSAIFFAPLLILLKNHPCYYFVKLVDSKGFTTFLPVCKKHTQTLKLDRFAPNFV